MNGHAKPARVALVTGGGTGIGRAITLRLAQKAIAVAVNYSRSQDEAEATVREVEAAGGQAFAIRADVSDDDDVRRMVDAVVERWGRLDIAVNNAAITRFVPFADLSGLSGDDWDRLMSVNVKGAFFVSRAAAKAMMATAGGGSIVNIGSIAGMTPGGSSIAYAASKAALIHMSACLARTLAPAIRVNTVSPGFVETRWTAGRKPGTLPPMGRVAQPDDVAEVVVAVATGFQHVTGENILVDGGQFLL